MRKKVALGLKELEAAEARSPDFEFVVSCRKAFRKFGSLTPAQIEGLKNVRTPQYRPAYGFDPFDPSTWEECPNGMYGDNPFDSDRD